MAHAISPIAVTIQKEKATQGSKMLVNCHVTHQSHCNTALNHHADIIAQGTTTHTHNIIKTNCIKSVTKDDTKPDIKAYIKTIIDIIIIAFINGIQVSNETKLPPAKSCTVTAIS